MHTTTDPGEFQVSIITTTTAAEVFGRPTDYVLGVVVGEGATALEALSGMEEMASESEANAVVDVRVIMQATPATLTPGIRYCAYGTAVALKPN